MRNEKNGFTLVELMVVLAVIGILMTSVFKLMSTVSNTRMDAETRAKLERIQNALSGYYAAYGCYPPVPLLGPTDPTGDIEEGGEKVSDESKKAILASRAQANSFEYPTPPKMDAYLNERFKDVPALTANQVNMKDEFEWEETKYFKFGLVSFLLPRVEIIEFNEMNQDVFKKQWGYFNKNSARSGYGNEETINWEGAVQKQRAIENEVCVKFLPNLEKIVNFPNRTVLGVNISDPRSGESSHYSINKLKDDRTAVVLKKASITDGWGNEFFYYSPPPYQSYRLWSAGPNMKTYPPWIASQDWGSRRDQISEWISDDIVGGSVQ